MTCAHFVLSLICLISIAQETRQSPSVHQERRLISVHVGDNVTLQCFYQKDHGASLISWYKQPLGKQPKIISTYHKHKEKGTFHDEYMNNQRFTLDVRKKTLHLTIYDVQVIDSATYYCVKYSYHLNTQFSEGTTVIVKDTDSFSNALVQQSDSETIHPGDSVILKCSASTEGCDGEPSVYWFKNSEDHHPSLIYTQSDKNVSQCERKRNQSHTCVYDLPLNNLDQSNAGTYYCAVTVCGRIVFGNGTRLEHKDKLTPVCVLSAALFLSTILVIVLSYLTYKMYKKTSCGSTASVTEDISQRTEDLNYAALSFNPPIRSHFQRQNECVYSSVNMS